MEIERGLMYGRGYPIWRYISCYSATLGTKCYVGVIKPLVGLNVTVHGGGRQAAIR